MREDICKKAVYDLAGGNMEALAVIYDEAARTVFSAALSVTGSVEDAEDALQNTMIEVSRYARSFKDGSARAWILTIARHCATDLMRKKRRETPLEDGMLERLPYGGAELEGVEALDLLRALSEDDRLLVLYRLYAGLPYRDIARIMDISAAVAQKRYQRALKKLRALM